MPEIDVEVAPVGDQRNKYGPTPPEIVVAAEPLAVPQVAGEVVVERTRADGCPIVIVAVEVHPKASEMTTE